VEKIGIEHLFHEHYDEPRKEERLEIICILALILTLVDGYLFYLTANDNLSWTMATILHAINSLAAFIILRFFILSKWDERFPELFFYLIAFLGPFGGGVFLVSLLLYFVVKSQISSIEKTITDFFPIDPEDELSFRIYERIRYGLDVFDPKKVPYSFEDVMHYGSVNQKKTAIERILKYFRPELSKPLLIALGDKNNSVRIMAANAVARIDSQYTTKLQTLEVNARKYPKEYQRLLDFADQSVWQSNLEILDEERRKKLRQRASDLYLEYLQKVPSDKSVKLSIAKLHYLNGEHDKAMRELRTILEENKEIDTEALVLLMRTLFAEKQYKDMHALARKEGLAIKGGTPLHEQLVDELLLWKRGIPYERLSMKEGYARNTL
jgi:hypothetical protein